MGCLRLRMTSSTARRTARACWRSTARRTRSKSRTSGCCWSGRTASTCSIGRLRMRLCSKGCSAARRAAARTSARRRLAARPRAAPGPGAESARRAAKPRRRAEGALGGGRRRAAARRLEPLVGSADAREGGRGAGGRLHSSARLRPPPRPRPRPGARCRSSSLPLRRSTATGPAFRALVPNKEGHINRRKFIWLLQRSLIAVAGRHCPPLLPEPPCQSAENRVDLVLVEAARRRRL